MLAPMNMKTFITKKILVAAFAALTCCSCLAQSSESPIRSYTEEDGSKLGWFVSRDTFLKTPEWQFDGKTPPPLDWAAAYSKALEWLKENKKEFGPFTLYSLTTQFSGNAPDRWYYIAEFRGTKSGKAVLFGELDVLVLMDGTIVEPRHED